VVNIVRTLLSNHRKINTKGKTSLVKSKKTSLYKKGRVKRIRSKRRRKR